MATKTPGQHTYAIDSGHAYRTATTYLPPAPRPPTPAMSSSPAAGASSGKRASFPRPSCTHVNLERVYSTTKQCLMCGRVSALGWLYACEQDRIPVRSFTQPKPRGKLQKGVRRLSMEMEALGLNRTIINAIEAGHYTHEQINQIKQQKLHVRAIIELQTRDLSAGSLKLGGRSTSSHRLTSSVSSTASESDSECKFRCCHACRPFYKDRGFLSFESVYRDEWKWKEDSYFEKPIRDARIMSTIGLRDPTPFHFDTYVDSDPPSPGSPNSPDSSSVHGLGIDYSYADPVEQQRQYFTKLRETAVQHGIVVDSNEGPETHGFRDSLLKTFQDLVKLRRASLTTNGTNNAEDEWLASLDSHEVTFNYELWKTLTEDLLAQAAAVKLPEDEPFASSNIDSKRPDFVVEGVALTEEAVETHSPDVITSNNVISSV